MAAFRIPVRDKDGNVITTLDPQKVDEAGGVVFIGVVFIGSGEARRTFRYNGKFSREAAFDEAETRDLVFDQGDDLDSLVSKDSIRCKGNGPASFPLHTDPRHEGPGTDPTFRIELRSGQRVKVTLEDTDGMFTIAYDFNANQMLTVSSDIPGNRMGDAGIIYCEEFGTTPGVSEPEEKEPAP